MGILRVNHEGMINTTGAHRLTSSYTSGLALGANLIPVATFPEAPQGAPPAHVADRSMRDTVLLSALVGCRALHFASMRLPV